MADANWRWQWLAEAETPEEEEEEEEEEVEEALGFWIGQATVSMESLVRRILAWHRDCEE
jgi:hypothetical protein